MVHLDGLIVFIEIGIHSPMPASTYHDLLRRGPDYLMTARL